METGTNPAKVIRKRIKRITVIENQDVYDIQTTTNHNFFANNILVHNCGEIAMLADAGIVEIDGVIYDHLGDICNLGHINVPMYYDKNKGFDWETYAADIALLVRSLDSIIDVSGYPLPGIEASAQLRRKIGCGLLGYGSLLMMMGFKYGSRDANAFTQQLMATYANAAYHASAMLAKEKGSFKLFDVDLIFNGGFVKNSGVLTKNTLDAIRHYGLRNSQLLTAAPTGTTGILMGLVSGGIEPVFDLDYIRWVTITYKIHEELRGLAYPDVTKGEWFETKDFVAEKVGDDDVLMSTCRNYYFDKNRGLVKKTECMDFGWLWCKENLSVEEMERYKANGAFTTAMDLTVEEHIDPFTIFSSHIDNSISKTVNLRADYPYEEFDQLFRKMWRDGVRGITTYREGTMMSVLETKKSNDGSSIKMQQHEFFDSWKDHQDGHIFLDDVSLPDEYPMKGYKIKSEGKKWYVSAAFKDHEMKRPFAIFVQTNNREPDVNTHACIEALTEIAKNAGIAPHIIDDNDSKMIGNTNVTKIARTLSLLLRHNIPIIDIIKTLDTLDLPIGSFIFRIKKFIANFIDEDDLMAEMTCPECGGHEFKMSEGCPICKTCSWTKCG